MDWCMIGGASIAYAVYLWRVYRKTCMLDMVVAYVAASLLGILIIIKVIGG